MSPSKSKPVRNAHNLRMPTRAEAEEVKLVNRLENTSLENAQEQARIIKSWNLHSEAEYKAWGLAMDRCTRQRKIMLIDHPRMQLAWPRYPGWYENYLVLLLCNKCFQEMLSKKQIGPKVAPRSELEIANAKCVANHRGKQQFHYESTLEDCDVRIGDALTELRKMPDESVDCVVTSPPYWLARNYGIEGQLGMEPTLEEYIDNMVVIFRQVRRVLKSKGTLWLNIGDTYATESNVVIGRGDGGSKGGESLHSHTVHVGRDDRTRTLIRKMPTGCKSKDLVGIPWMLAFALQSDGWFLRSDIIWDKVNPMPEAVKDRPAKQHEYIFLFTKIDKGYTYNYEAVMSKSVSKPHPGFTGNPGTKASRNTDRVDSRYPATGLYSSEMRLLHDVWLSAPE